MRTLGELFAGLVDAAALRGREQQMVAGVFDDSRRVTPGSVFVALRGATADGRKFISSALERGAAVLVGESIEPADGALVLNVADARALLARLAVRWHGLETPAGGHFELLGVTGTNGKTTTAFMTRAILQAAGRRCGLLGTVQYDLCSRSVVADMTTPGPLQLAACLRECADAGATAAVMEVSSHALDQRRTDGLRFAAAAFSNLTRDHLDYHGDFENYAAAKARLFAGLDASATAVVNIDDPWHERMLRDCRARVLRCSMKGTADVSASILRESIRGTFFRLRIGADEMVVENAIVGRHNVYNALAAAGLAVALGLPREAILAGLAGVRNVPGRLQRVPLTAAAEVFVDYAHTDDALRNVLSVLRPLTRKRLIVVFGCGGDRDRTKRPLMAQAVAAYADAIIVTSDNPRTEEPLAIIRDICAGFDATAQRRVVVEPDRRAAIRSALAAAQPGDSVLLAGKGHEDYQILGSQKHHFDDVEVAIQAVADLAGRRPDAA